MKALKSVKKLPRLSIDNPVLRKRMKPSANSKKNLNINVGLAVAGRVLLTSSVTEKEKSAAGQTKFGKLNSSINLNQSSSSLSVSWKDSLRDFRKATLPVPERNLSVRRTPEKETRSASVKARRAKPRVRATSPLRSSSRLKEREAKSSPEESAVSSSNVSVIGQFKFHSSSAPSTPTTSSASSKSRFPPRRPTTTKATSLKVSSVREFRFQPAASTSSSTPSGLNSSISRLPTRVEVSGGSNYLTPLARSLRAPGDNLGLANSSSSVSGAKRLHNCSITSVIEEKSSPKNQARQRGVVLPLLQEKDLVIQDLERKVERLQEEERVQQEKTKKVHKELMEENEKLKKENEKLKENFEISGKFQQELRESEDKLYSLEMKNVKILEALEAERAQVESLQSEVSRLSSDNVESQEERDSDLASLVETFLQKVREGFFKVT